VHDAGRVRVGEAGEHALQHAAHLGQRQLPHPRPQRPARHVLHRDVRRPVELEELEHRDDVRMAQRARDARLAQEAPDHLSVLALQRAELLERGEAVEVDLPHEMHAGHPAAAELAQDLVPPEPPSLSHARILTAEGPGV
jgi:hypothetical protein